jgi:hypothetical protein
MLIHCPATNILKLKLFFFLAHATMSLLNAGADGKRLEALISQKLSSGADDSIASDEDREMGALSMSCGNCHVGLSSFQ